MSLVKKRDDSYKLCKKLNKLTLKNKYHLLRIDDLMDQLHGAVIFSNIYLRLGYHQILVKIDDVQKTTFRSRYEHYECGVMPFGVTNTLAMFMDYIIKIFRLFLDKFIVVAMGLANVTNHTSNKWEVQVSFLKRLVKHLTTLAIHNSIRQ